MKGMSNFTIFDEAFYSMTWAHDPGIHVLASTVIPATPSAGAHKGEVVPQIWTYEHTLDGGQPARAFVWMQGHEYANFANYQIQQMLLRGIAWAGPSPSIPWSITCHHPRRIPRPPRIAMRCFHPAQTTPASSSPRATPSATLPSIRRRSGCRFP